MLAARGRALFDYYERTHLNHVMAAQDPKTGLFV